MRWKVGLSNKIIILFVYSVLILMRVPHAVLQGGRFIFEDGTIFFSYAWHFSSTDALLRPFGGYLNLAANAGTLLAARLVQWHLVPLRFAPAVPSFVAFLFQLVPAVLILWGRIDWLKTLPAKVMALLSISCAALSEESWLNIMHAQLWLTLSCILLVVSRVPRKWYSWLGEVVILILAPLCGMSAILVTPFFLVKTVRDRSWARGVQSLFLSLGGVIQLCFFYSKSPVRHLIYDGSLVVNLVFLRMELVTFLGYWAHYAGKGLKNAYLGAIEGNGWEWYGWTGGALVAVVALIWLCWRYRFTDVGMLFSAGLLVALVSFFGGGAMNSYEDFLQPKLGEHYNFLPTVCFAMGLLALWQNAQTRREAKWAKGVYLWVMCIALGSYPFHSRMFRNGPAWGGEVAIWQKNLNYRPHTWLGTDVDLSESHEPCPDVARQVSSFAAPHYCEVLWNAVMMRSYFRWPD